MINNEQISNILIELANKKDFVKISQKFHISLSHVKLINKIYAKEIDVISASHQIKLLLSQEQLDAALQICNNPDYKDNIVIQSQAVQILIKKNELDVALNICDSFKYSSAVLNSQKITILLKLNKINEALQVCNNSLFKDNNYIKSQKKVIMNIINHNFQETLFKIKANEITLNEIESTNFNTLSKIILTFAFYEKNKYSNKILLNFLKKYIYDYHDNSDVLKILNILKNRVSTKTKFFDINFYQQLYTIINIDEENSLENNNCPNR